jgi:hypothetical protein
MRLSELQLALVAYTSLNIFVLIAKLGIASTSRFQPDKTKLTYNFQRNNIVGFVAIAVCLPAYTGYVLRYIYAKEVDTCLNFIENVFNFQPYVFYKKHTTRKD